MCYQCRLFCSGNTNILLEYFHPENIPLILKLQPSNTWSMDGYAWTYTNSGTYYVKSRYNRLHETKVCDAEVQVVQPSITGLLSHVWNPCSWEDETFDVASFDRMYCDDRKTCL